MDKHSAVDLRIVRAEASKVEIFNELLDATFASNPPLAIEAILEKHKDTPHYADLQVKARTFLALRAMNSTPELVQQQQAVEAAII